MRPTLSVTAHTRLLVVAPHPDDETLGCGVLVQQVLAAGGEICVLLLTDGDNNPWPQRYIERRVTIDVDARQRWGARRRREVVLALDRLGVPATALHAFGWLDMELTDRLRSSFTDSVGVLRSAIDAFRPTLMCCPALRDNHPDHGAAHVMCRLALWAAEASPVLLAYPVHGAADPAAYPLQLEASVDQRERKLAAMHEHQTQMTLSGRRLRRLSLSPERYMQVEEPTGGGRLPWQPPRVLQPWLRLLVATPSGVRDLPWQEASTERDRAGGYRWPAAMSSASPIFLKLHLDWPSPWIFDHWGWHLL